MDMSMIQMKMGIARKAVTNIQATFSTKVSIVNYKNKY
jgi:hypothetical protein